MQASNAPLKRPTSPPAAKRRAVKWIDLREEVSASRQSLTHRHGVGGEPDWSWNYCHLSFVLRTPGRQFLERRKLRAALGPLDQFANQVNRLELRFDCLQARRVGEEIIAGPLLYPPLDPVAKRAQEPVQFPTARAKRADVADWAHRHLDQAAGIR